MCPATSSCTKSALYSSNDIIISMDLSGIQTKRAWRIILLVSGLAISFLVWIIYFKEPPTDSEHLLPFLPALNCLLNGCSAICLVIGYVAIRRGQVRRHIRWMISAFICSAVFLVSYILHHHLHGDTKFPADNGLRPFYLIILATHILLSVAALPMIFMTFFFALSGRLATHRRLAKFTFPVWLYVSVTGVLIFLILKSAGA